MYKDFEQEFEKGGLLFYAVASVAAIGFYGLIFLMCLL